MYRPTVRYDDIFREYVDGLFHATHLDRNQIIRAALFASAHSKEFQNLMNEYKKTDVSLPSPLWDNTQHRYWMEQRPETNERGKDVNVKHGGKGKDSEVDSGNFGSGFTTGSEGFERTGRIEQVPGRTGEIPSQRIVTKGKGGITIKINKAR
jgi:hypothetical protein